MQADKVSVADQRSAELSLGDVSKRNKNLIYLLFILLLFYAGVRALEAARGRPFWYDEFMTLAVSSRGTWKGIVASLRAALDSQPPLFYVVENVALKLSKNEEVGLRLPSILGILCTLTCIFIYTKRQYGEVVGFLCALFLLTTNLFQYYAIEGRSYSMVVACVAFALVCYQRASAPLWRALLGGALALAESLHYLSFLAMVPFVLAELGLLVKTHRFRWGVWSALAFAAVPLALFWRLLVAFKVYYGSHLWSRFYVIPPTHAYAELLNMNSQTASGVAAVVFAGVLGQMFYFRATEDEQDQGEVVQERILLLGFIALPILCYLITAVLKSGFTPRYALCAVLGVSAGLGLIASRAGIGATILFGVFVFSVAGVNEIRFWQSARLRIAETQALGTTLQTFIKDVGYEKLPVIVPSVGPFLSLVHYSSPSIDRRFTFLVQDAQPNNKHWSDTNDRELRVLQSYWPLHLSSFGEFTGTNREFLVYVDKQANDGNWVLSRLLREGWQMQSLAVDDNRAVYFVKRQANCEQGLAQCP